MNIFLFIGLIKIYLIKLGCGGSKVAKTSNHDGYPSNEYELDTFIRSDDIKISIASKNLQNNNLDYMVESFRKFSNLSIVVSDKLTNQILYRSPLITSKNFIHNSCVFGAYSNLNILMENICSPKFTDFIYVDYGKYWITMISKTKSNKMLFYNENYYEFATMDIDYIEHNNECAKHRVRVRYRIYGDYIVFGEAPCYNNKNFSYKADPPLFVVKNKTIDELSRLKLVLFNDDLYISDLEDMVFIYKFKKINYCIQSNLNETLFNLLKNKDEKYRWSNIDFNSNPLSYNSHISHTENKIYSGTQYVFNDFNSLSPEIQITESTKKVVINYSTSNLRKVSLNNVFFCNGVSFYGSYDTMQLIIPNYINKDDVVAFDTVKIFTAFPDVKFLEIHNNMTVEINFLSEKLEKIFLIDCSPKILQNIPPSVCELCLFSSRNIKNVNRYRENDIYEFNENITKQHFNTIGLKIPVNCKKTILTNFHTWK